MAYLALNLAISPSGLMLRNGERANLVMSDAQKQDVMIFAEALDLHLSERAAHLDRACAGDQKLRQRVEGLLLTHDQAGGFLERPPVEMAIGSRLGAFAGEKPGDRIGRYKLAQQIGEGGYGGGFLAEQE